MGSMDDSVPLPCVCTTLRRAARTVSAFYDHALAQAGLTVTQYALLAKIGRADGVSMTALAEQMGMDRTTLTRNLTPLARRQLVSAGAGEDRRERILRLTDTGREQLEMSYPLWAEAQRQMLEQLGKRRWRQLRKALAAAEGVISSAHPTFRA